MSERLTYDEIIEKYPRQWVGLTDVIFEDNDDFNVTSGVVKYYGLPRDELTMIMLRSNGTIVMRHTDPDSTVPLGILG